MQGIIMCMFATILVAIWIILAIKGRDKFDEIIESIDDDIFYFPQLFVVGLQVSQIIKPDTKSDKARARMKEIGEIEGKRYAEYYYYIMYAAKWTYGLTSLTLMALLSAMIDSVFLFVCGILIAVTLVAHVDGALNDKLKERKELLLGELPGMLSKMALLVNSGMVLRDAWRKVAKSGEGVIYKEMNITLTDLDNGVSEFKAYRDFGDRCATKEVKRVSSMIIQNLTKANEEIAYLLKNMSDEMWREKKYLAKQKGETVNSRLMFPTALIFIGIMIMVMVPAFMNMGL